MSKYFSRIEILPATEEDCPTLAQVEEAAFSQARQEESRSLSEIMFGPPAAEGESLRAQDLVHKMQTDPTTRLYKATIKEEATNMKRIVGWSVWNHYLEPQPMEERKDTRSRLIGNEDAFHEFFGALLRARKLYMSGKPFCLLGVLVTLPEYQGRGVGSALLEFGISEATKAGLSEFWLEASADGYSLYRKFGFENVDFVHMDLTKYGSVGQTKHVCMKKSLP
ncbi:hypothetical protein NUU61_003615 [Penicillium alfredii]|uniref:N-acetyltransferase domain-containing protein n=1 Tax=Penicillium alfredii TaxID=1506179 RepID=A0A9W9FJJ0_9EURO|nr:uncharacterized protein NUU61_003615 [Penicillium alfredii]KAJ5101393.1 hypothetical protein NUU61_003615 [Penicillium alfredii]